MTFGGQITDEVRREPSAPSTGLSSLHKLGSVCAHRSHRGSLFLVVLGVSCPRSQTGQGVVAETGAAPGGTAENCGILRVQGSRGCDTCAAAHPKFKACVFPVTKLGPL